MPTKKKATRKAATKRSSKRTRVRKQTIDCRRAGFMFNYKNPWPQPIVLITMPPKATRLSVLLDDSSARRLRDSLTRMIRKVKKSAKK